MINPFINVRWLSVAVQSSTSYCSLYPIAVCDIADDT
jgi:hypothetical protein